MEIILKFTKSTFSQ